MSVSEDLLPGSYKGVSFLMSRSQMSGGRKDVKQSFPNTDKQTIEDLGLLPRIFSVDVIITADATGEFYLQRRNRFLGVLDEGGPGVLIHPFYGQLENMVARSYTVLEDMTEIGDGKINILFEVNNDPGTPARAENTLSVVEARTNTAVNAFRDEVATTFEVSATSPNNYTSAITKMTEMVDEFNSNITFLSVAAGSIDTFSRQISDFGKSITFLATEPQRLADSVTGLFQTIDGLYTTVDATFNVLRRFFDFGDNDITINDTTVSLQERKTNNLVLNGIMQGQALSYAYLNAAQIDFDTVADIDEVAEILEEQYQKIINSDLREEVKAPLTEVRVAIQQFFDEQRLTAQQIINIHTSIIPARVLAYQYYGESARGASLAELNNDLNVTFLEGDLDIVTA